MLMYHIEIRLSLCNFLLLLLSVLGVAYISQTNGFYKVVTPLITISLLIIIFSEMSLQGRLLYILPIVPLSTMGLGYLFRVLSYLLKRTFLFNKVFILLIVYVCTIQLNYLLRSMTILLGFI